MIIQTFYVGLTFSSRNLLDSAAGGTFMSITLGAAMKLINNMMVNYSEWHTERAPQENCYFDVPLADVAKKKPLVRINDVLIMVNNKLVPVDFLVLDIECNASFPIILGRPFLRTIGAIIDMKEGTIKYQFPLKKGMKHFPRKINKLPFDSIIRENYDVDAPSFENTRFSLSAPSSKALKKSTLGR
jgi:hypothetical protein